MSTPKQHHSKGRVTRKRYRYIQKPARLGVCPNCSSPTTPHRACKSCGQYKGRQIVSSE